MLHGKPAVETPCPQVLNVAAFCEHSHGLDSLDTRRSKVHYTILMRHYPFPPPRVAPARLTGGLIPWAGEEAASQAWGGCNAA